MSAENIFAFKTFKTGMQKPAFILILFLGIAGTCSAQKPWELGGEFIKSIGKIYKGNIAGARYESYTNKNSFNIGLTYHFTGNSSFSGSKGFGLFAGLRHGFGSNLNSSNPFIGIRILFSFENFDGKTNLNSLMITPVGEAGYHFGKTLFVAPSVGWGYTIKITKEYNSLDEDVGGRIMPGLAAGLRF